MSYSLQVLCICQLSYNSVAIVLSSAKDCQSSLSPIFSLPYWLYIKDQVARHVKLALRQQTTITRTTTHINTHIQIFCTNIILKQTHDVEYELVVVAPSTTLRNVDTSWKSRQQIAGNPRKWLRTTGGIRESQR